MKQKILRELKSNLEYMSVAERKIANVILSNPRKFVSFSLGELARVAQVSQGSIINFSNKYCGGGFPVLKMEIAASLSHENEKPFSLVNPTDSLSEIFHKTAGNIYDALQNTSVQNEERTLREVCDKILEAKKIEIYGIFRSAVVATDLCCQLLQLGIPATFVSDVLTCAVSASMLDRECLVIAISLSGQTQDVINAVKYAKSNGAPVVAITANKQSALAKLSDMVLIAASSGTSLSTHESEIRLSQLVITDTLCAYLRNKIDADGSNRYFKMREVLNSHSVKD